MRMKINLNMDKIVKERFNKFIFQVFKIKLRYLIIQIKI